MVIYKNTQEIKIDILSQTDSIYYHDLNSWDLECYTCNKNLKIIPISQREYDGKYNEVNLIRLLKLKK